MEIKRCPWPSANEQMIAYHDNEWGVPLHDDRRIFEFLTLEAFQAGLSWAIIMRKRANFGKAFHKFDYRKIAKYTESDVKRLLADEGIIRNRLKILATIENAKRFLEVQKEFGSFDKYMWSFVNHRTISNNIRKMSDYKPTSKESDAWSKDMKKRGFKFLGSTVCYAHMQAVGMVNDHMTDCFRYKQL